MPLFCTENRGFAHSSVTPFHGIELRMEAVHCAFRIFSYLCIMNVIELTDLERPELDVFMHLTEAQLRNRLEPQKGIFIAESLKVVRIALQQGYEPVAILTEAKYLDSQLAPLIEGRYEVPVYTAPAALLATLTGYALTRGFLCAMRRPQLPTVEAVCRDARRVAVVDGVANSTNTGAIFRAAAALGIDGVLLTSTCCDPLNRRSVRVSMGTLFQLPWTNVGLDRQPLRFPEVHATLHALGFQTVALALTERACAIDDPRLAQADRLAILLGSEGDGLPAETIDSCDHVAKIPMLHGVDSLNVAAAAAVAFWQLCRR